MKWEQLLFFLFGYYFRPILHLHLNCMYFFFKENQIHQRIAELRKEGLWSLRRLPKLQEAPRPKSHWDYLLEEMQWMATDFAQERKWKMATAKKVLDEHFLTQNNRSWYHAAW